MSALKDGDQQAQTLGAAFIRKPFTAPQFLSAVRHSICKS